MPQKRYKNGLMIGKFMPPHRGHELMIDFGISMCKNMHVYVHGSMQDKIPVLIRASILEMEQPKAYYFWEEELEPATPTYDEDGTAVEEWYWALWVTKIQKYFPKIDAVFTNDKYGEKLARLLDADWCPIDLERNVVPISATKIRENIQDNWKFLLPGAQTWLHTKICLVGPESVGKSTLARDLAQVYNAGLVTEYGRTISEIKNNKLEKEDFLQIVKGRDALENSMQKLYPISFIDTDGYTTSLFSSLYLSEKDSKKIEYELELSAKYDNYDLYLVLSPDINWVNDGFRVAGNQRVEMFDKIVDYLSKNGKNFKLIQGYDFSDRFEQAITYVNDHITNVQKI
jgi:NadR type nicotinamide-nucleotide adenylyltransferase